MHNSASYEEKIRAYESAREALIVAAEELRNESDGFEYITHTRSYGTLTVDKHVNSYTVKELCDKYYGDNGFVDVYTNNPDSGICTEGRMVVVPQEELDQYIVDEISQSEALSNWIMKFAK